MKRIFFIRIEKITFILITTSLFLFPNCGTMLDLPKYSYPEYEKSKYNVGVKKFWYEKPNKGNSIFYSEEDATNILINVANESKIFKTCKLFDIKQYIESDFNYILQAKILDFKYSEGPTIASCLFSEGFWYGWVVGIGILVVTNADFNNNPLAYLGLLGIASGTIKILIDAFGSSKTGSDHAYDIIIEYTFTDTKSKEKIIADTVSFNYSNVFTHSSEYKIGEYYSGRWELTEVYNKEWVNLSKVKSLLEKYVVKMTSEKILDKIAEKLNLLKYSKSIGIKK